MLQHAATVTWCFFAVICISLQITVAQPVLFECGFENDVSPFCGLTGHVDDAFNWTRSESGRGTPTTGTGPSLAAHGMFFAYIESSLPRHPGDFASLVTPNLAYHGRVCVKFNYHMVGNTMGSLEMGAGNQSRRPDFSRHSSTANMVWEQAEEDVLLVPPLDWIRIIATVGSGVKSDIGLDEVKITKGCCGDCNSQWLAWLPWSHCDVTCGNGTKTRSRKCDYSKMYFNTTLQRHVFRVYDLYYCGPGSNDTAGCSQPVCTDLAVKSCVPNCQSCDNKTGLCNVGQCEDRFARSPDGYCGACAPNCRRCVGLIAMCEKTQCEVAHAYAEDTKLCIACVDQCLRCEEDIARCDSGQCNKGYEISFYGTCVVEGTRRYIITVSLSVGGVVLVIAIITIPLLIWAYIRWKKRKAEMAELWRRHRSHPPKSTRTSLTTPSLRKVPVVSPPPVPYIVRATWTSDEDDDDSDAYGNDRSDDEDESDDEESLTLPSVHAMKTPLSLSTFGTITSVSHGNSTPVSGKMGQGTSTEMLSTGTPLQTLGHTPRETLSLETPGQTSRQIRSPEAQFLDAK